MAGQKVSHEQAKVGGLFDRIGDFVIQWPLIVIGVWIAVVAALALLLPPLQAQAAQREQKPLPDDAPTTITTREMGKAFRETGSGSLLLVILTNEKGLGPVDEDVYRKLIDNLRQDTQDKMSVQDFLSVPPMREILESKDKKAWNLPINFPGDPTAPETQAALKRVGEIVKKTVAGTSLTANLSGPVATVADLQALGEADVKIIEIGTAVSVLIILIIVYRNLITMLMPLVTIGASVVGAQGLLSGLTELGLVVNMQSIVFMTAVMIGAGTDYAVFLISRYHDYVRHGEDSDQAVKKALMSIGKVIAASAATVAVTFLAMVFTKLEVFSAVGPAIAVSIMVTFLAATTLLPAILVLTGRRGWIKPRRDLTTRFWRRSGTRIVRRPKIHLVGSLVVLIILAGSASLIRFNYDDLKTVPQDVDSVKGYEALNRHFPMNAMTPIALLVQSPRDLRTPAALADLEMMSRRIADLPDIVMVRGLTRPNGEPLKETKVSFQAGEVGSKLGEASGAIADHRGDLDKLAGGARQLADALAQIRDQVNGAVTSASGLVTTLQAMMALMGGDRTIQQLDHASQFVGRMRTLGDNLSGTVAQAEQTAVWANPMVIALNSSPVCNKDPACVKSRGELAAIVEAENNGLLRSIAALAVTLQQTQDYQTLAQTVGKLDQQLKQVVNTLKAVNGLPTKLAQMQMGANALADGSAAVAAGVEELVKQVKTMGSGLNEASDFLLGMKRDAERPSMAGFNIPPQIMTRDEFKKGAQIFLSPDGHAARYLVQSSLNGATPAGMDQVNKIIAAAQSAQPNTELADAKVSLLGVPTGLRDIRDYYNNDIKFIVIATIIIVFLILVALLRAIVAPLYLIGSVLVSYLSALGLGVIVFQLILGQEMHWSLPGLSFILLVAVGADYNMLLISRIRDESPHGVRVGVIRTVGSTGGVITSAGLIFAASMFGLVGASINVMAQAGFTIGIGIVIDTFLVRTVTVPALAAMIGQANWWPSTLGQGEAPLMSLRNRIRKASLQLSGMLNRTAKTPVSGRPTTNVAPRSNGHGQDDVLAKLDGYPLYDLGGHAIPLFGPVGLPQLTNACTTTAEGNGKDPTIDLTGQALPLFSLSPQNGNGHPNGTDGREHPLDDLTIHPLPLFGCPVGVSHDGVDGTTRPPVKPAHLNV
ncbi:MMPL/RND family transporter [Mycobacterium lacus]|uniref:Putative transport protein MmpL12 n=1 Tax=Mycobacterium lacus TaxID=169765 RepID=A0A7I7NKS0_9MYCO|nr:RND family transporter [Mycobacterium lacus]MCV7124431.1 RND family transporter [Mycobacterium lacus]BBX96087.1 putative transport protein MmpL12 [Mycobacterium lacus]